MYCLQYVKVVFNWVIDVYIEGHTDSKPINTAQFKDNWDLSVIRATSVVRILTKDYGVNPLQIQPCGRGEFMPVADNETADGRSKNRRGNGCFCHAIPGGSFV